jgi:hypothetical protein
MIRWFILILVAFVSWKVGPIYAASLRFNFAVSEACKTGATGRLPLEDIRNDILFKAEQLDLPVYPEDIRLRVSAHLVGARVAYEVPVDLGPREWLLKFHASALETPLVVMVGGEQDMRKARE